MRYLTPDGRAFDLIERRPYVRKDGTASAVLVWQCLCAECAAPFEVTTPVNYEGTQSFGRKHCDEHKLTQAQITARGLTAIRAARSAAKAQKKANVRK